MKYCHHHHHHHHHLLLLLSLIIFSFGLISADEYGCQNNSFCGDIQIARPFWVPGESDYYCGNPDLKVTCKDNETLTFNTSTDSYTVKSINYEDKILSLVDTDVLSESCPRIRHNVSISNIPLLGYDPDVTVNLTFFFNCSSALSDEYLSKSLEGPLNQSTCLDSNTAKTYVFVGEEVNNYEWLKNECKDQPVVAPVVGDGLNQSNVDELFPAKLKDGFELQWDESRETKNCTLCQNSQGICGYLKDTGNGYDFYCYCKDGKRLKDGICQEKSNGKPNKVKILIGGASASLFLCLVIVTVYVCRKHKNSSLVEKSSSESLVLRNGIVYSNHLNNTSFQFMDIITIQAATHNFSDANKLGEGGFGAVYKGTLRDGTEIAIKRLSITSTQGSEEFKNEVELISRLQHRNLVKLLGCCTDDNEKLLIYEYLPNKSLDAFIFDPLRRFLWEWSTIAHIILGITRGLLYLHEDSLLRIVHRDMKPANILLDLQMNPKISDFGLARIFNNEEDEVNTRKVVGTFGYMAPEFAMTGVFSIKSDVFSFGVVLLEIIGGNKNGSSYFIQQGQSLLSKAWSLWRERRGLEFIDHTIVEHHSFQKNKIAALRCINIALLCVQDNPMDRPTMSLVLRMLTSEQTILPEPKQPPSVFMHDDGSTVQRNHWPIFTALGENQFSINETTMSQIYGR